MIDNHVHTFCSGDCTAPMIDMCQAAVDRGIDVITFTDHVDYCPTDVCYGKYDYDLYMCRIAEARERFAGRLDIRCGVEVDYLAKYADQIGEFLRGKHFDYVLGSTHYVGDIILEDHELYFPGKNSHEAYAPYFDNVLATARTGLFDVLAHMDLCKRYGVMYFGALDWSPYRERVEDILRTVIDRGMALEINTSGLRQAPGDTYPCRGILELYYSLGGRRISIGSDSHKPEDVGAGIAAAMQMAREIGFDAVATFNQRQCTMMSIT